MKIRIGNFAYTEVWDGIFYKKLADYPHITPWEIRTIIEFISYEKANGRECSIESGDKPLWDFILKEIGKPAEYRNAARPKLLTECTACPQRRGCETEFVCHTAPPANAIAIFQCGCLLSAVKARGKPAEELAKEPRNAAKDPADYFHYVMFTWGNCQAGDRLVMERKLNRFPNETDLSRDFTPGIRFYFRYETLVQHPRCVFDGVLPLKIRDEVILKDWVCAIVIPAAYKEEFAGAIPGNLQNKVLYVENAGKDIWEWSEKVYSVIEKI